MKLLFKSSVEDVDIFVESASEFSLIDSSFGLHTILNTVFSVALTVAAVKSTQTLVDSVLGIVDALVVMDAFGSSQWLCRLEFHGSDFTFTRMPVLDRWHFMDS